MVAMIMTVKVKPRVSITMNTQRPHPPTPTIVKCLRQRDTYLNTAEVMALLGVTRSTLCGWVRKGLIRAARIGKENRFDPVALAKWIEEREIELHSVWTDRP
jgi:excisionase family DNA binding protein